LELFLDDGLLLVESGLLLLDQACLLVECLLLELAGFPLVENEQDYGENREANASDLDPAGQAPESICCRHVLLRVLATTGRCSPNHDIARVAIRG